jgi:hypothetical protein
VPALVRLSLRLTATSVGSGASFDDTSNSNRILAVVAILAAIGVLMLIFSYWYWRSTRPEPAALAPLELLSSRRVRKAPPEVRRRVLDEVRPASAGEPGQRVLTIPEPDLADFEAMAARELPPLVQLQEAARMADPVAPSVTVGPVPPLPVGPPLAPVAAPAVDAERSAEESGASPEAAGSSAAGADQPPNAAPGRTTVQNLPPPAAGPPSALVEPPPELADASVGDASSDADVRPVP